MKWAHWLNALIGLWFILSPWTLNYSSHSGALWLGIIAGVIQLVVSLWAVGLKQTTWGTWQTWVGALMGLWFVIDGGIFGLAAGALWTNLILGVISIILALLAMGSSKSSK